MQSSEKWLPLQRSLRLTSPRLVYTIMAKARVSTNPMYKGGAGGYTFYVRGGEQVIRQRKNNSNYGDTASRTRAQMLRRIRWGNLVNVYKAISSWQKKAYDSKLVGQTDYNIFMQLNINKVLVAESKEMCEAGCAVFEDYQVSRGSLAPINLELVGGSINYKSSINLTESITGTTTVGALSADILANNPDFLPGDNIAIIFARNYMVSRVEWPYVSSVYAEITLDASSATLISSISALANRLTKSEDDTLGILGVQTIVSNPLHEVGAVMIHTRKSSTDLKVSSQSIVMNDPQIITQFSGSAWEDTCILSYGLTEEALLEPNFKFGTIQSVTANGVVVENADSLTGSQELRVYVGEDGGDDVRLFFNGVEYTPLFRGDGYLGYILGDNGVCRLFSGESLYLSFSLSGIVVPEGFPTRLRMVQVPTTNASIYQEGATNLRVVNDANCINYGFKKSEELPYFILTISGLDLGTSDIELNNCAVKNYSQTSGGSNFNFSVTSAEDVAYVIYQGLVIAVFNYST